MGYGLLNLGSLIMGLIALLLPITNLTNLKKVNSSNWFILTFVSVSLCAISLYMQLIYGNFLIYKQDLSALLSMGDGVLRVSTILIVVTLLLNTITMVLYYKKHDGLPAFKHADGSKNENTR